MLCPLSLSLSLSLSPSVGLGQARTLGRPLEQAGLGALSSGREGIDSRAATEAGGKVIRGTQNKTMSRAYNLMVGKPRMLNLPHSSGA